MPLPRPAHCKSARRVYGHEKAALDGLSAFVTQAAKPGCCKLAAALSYHKLFMVYTMRNAMSLNSKAIVSSRGQVVIPRALREKLGIHAGEEIFFYVRHDGEIELKRLTRSIEQFCGRCKRVNETMPARSEEHTSELRHQIISYAVFCLKKKTVTLPAMLTARMTLSSIALARRGLLITRLNAVEDAATMDVLCADKTGTLTMNRLSFGGIAPQPGFDSEDVIRAGALASNAANADPIDRAFLQEASARGILEKTAKPRSFKPFSATTRHTRAVVEIDGRAVHAVKGALRTVAKAAGLDRAAIAALEARAEQAARQGMRALAVARAEDDQPLQLVGLAFLYDAPRPDAQHLIDKLRALGIQIKMLTGDALIVAREIARMLGLHKILRAPKWRAMQQEAHARAENLA